MAICNFLLIVRLALVAKRGQAFGEVLAADVMVVGIDFRPIALMCAVANVGQR